MVPRNIYLSRLPVYISIDLSVHLSVYLSFDILYNKRMIPSLLETKPYSNVGSVHAGSSF